MTEKETRLNELDFSHKTITVQQLMDCLKQFPCDAKIEITNKIKCGCSAANYLHNHGAPLKRVKLGMSKNWTTEYCILSTETEVGSSK